MTAEMQTTPTTNSDKSDTTVINEDKPVTSADRQTRRQGQKMPLALREKCRAEVQAAYLNGENVNVTCEKLGIHKSTYYVMLDKLAEETKTERLNKSDRLLHVYVSRIEADRARLNKLLDETSVPMQRALIIKEMNDITDKAFNRLQSAGFIPKIKENPMIAVQNNTQIGIIWELKKLQDNAEQVNKLMTESKDI